METAALLLKSCLAVVAELESPGRLPRFSRITMFFAQAVGNVKGESPEAAWHPLVSPAKAPGQRLCQNQGGRTVTIFSCNLCLSALLVFILSIALADLSANHTDAIKAQRMSSLERRISFVVSRRLAPRGELGEL